MSYQYPGPPSGPQPQQPYGQQPYGQPAYPPQQLVGPGGVPPLADWGTRVLGYLVDAAPLMVLAVIAIIIELVALRSFNFGLLGFVALLWLAGVVYAIWNRAYRRGTTGQSLGQKVVKIRTVDATTMQPLGFGMAFVRELAHVVDSIPLDIGWLSPLWDARNQTWADKIMNSVVIVDPAGQGAPGPGAGMYGQQPGGYQPGAGGYPQQHGGYQPGAGMYGQQPGGYQPGPGGYPQQPGGYQPGPGGYPQTPPPGYGG